MTLALAEAVKNTNFVVGERKGLPVYSKQKAIRHRMALKFILCQINCICTSFVNTSV
jgi:hypothetical protein